jgi:topoisomerase-4 subunit A
MTRSKTRVRAARSDEATLDLFDAGAGNTGAGAPPNAVAAGGDDAIDMAAFAERSYLTCAMSVVRGRAIPNIEDGQKPVQRRILYSMHELGLRAGVQHTKSARIVGEVLGKYHPHGDASTYDALVRMAQGFSLRYPLIDGQGNFGTRTVIRPPQCRYRSTVDGHRRSLLSEIDQDTVDFVELRRASDRARALPARLPMLLLNGASGVAVGMACELPPHNMREAAKRRSDLRHPKTTAQSLMSIIEGPDFPGGGQIISPRQAIVDAYTSGRGSLRARCRWKVENLARGQWQVIVYELPPTTSVHRVMSEIEEATNPKPREKNGKVTATQTNLKQLMLGALGKVNDESDKKSKVRLVLEPRSSRQEPEEFMRLMLAHTSLEENFSVNLVVLGIDGRPGRKNIREILDSGCSSFSTVTRAPAPAVPGRKPHSYPRGPSDGPAQYREGDQDHTRVGRAQAGADETLPPHRVRRTFSKSGCATRAARRHQNPERAEGIEAGAQGLKALLGSDTEMKKLVAGDSRRCEIRRRAPR